MIKKRFLSMLVLLCLTVSGAWAGKLTPLTTILSADNADFTSGSKTFNNIATVTFSGNVSNDGDVTGWFSGEERTLTVTAAAGYTITGVKFYNNSGSAFDYEAPFEAILVFDGGIVTKVNDTSIGNYGVTKIEVYGNATPAPATVAVTGVTLLPTTATLTLGETETVTLTATVLPDNATDKSVAWSSSNEAVATVSNEGVVTAVAAGTATITVTTTDGAKTATCTVTVATPTYKVSVKEGTEDATSWQGKAGTGEYQALPLEGVAAGTAVTVKYDGRKRVRSVKAVKKGGALAVPLTMEALTAGNIQLYMSNTLTTGMKYSVNNGEKTLITTATTIPVNAGDKVQFYGNGTSTQVYGLSPEVMLQGTAQTKVYGNIMSLLDEDNFATLTALPNEDYVFYGLFYENTNLTDASGLLLPATTLANLCYNNMFRGCTSLTTAPALPAATLTGHCYDGMFYGCTNLTTAPTLPATTLAEGCYNSMFEGCTSLVTAPALPSTTLYLDCYRSMFKGCTSLTTAPVLPATTLANYCYRSMFSGCTSLTTAPVLPATTLAESCYNFMFNGCTSLNSVTCMATDISASYCTSNWLKGVASTGTFTKASGSTWPTGNNGIPSGWTENEQ